MTTTEILRWEAGIVAILLTLWLAFFLGREALRALRIRLLNRRRKRRESKRINYILAGVLVLFAACGDNEDPEPTPDAGVLPTCAVLGCPEVAFCPAEGPCTCMGEYCVQ